MFLVVFYVYFMMWYGFCFVCWEMNRNMESPMKKHLAGLLASMSLLATGHATAAVFDFAAIANGDITVSGITGEQGAASFVLTVDGITLTASALNGDYAYLDSFYNGNPGGLGVCGTLTGSAQCDPSSDDNVTFGETLFLSFDQPVTIDTTVMRNGTHGTSFTGNFELSIDGGAAVSYGLTNIFDTNLTGTTFAFYNPNAGGSSGVSNDQQFYLQSLTVNPVPVPAAVWLFGSGLLGLAAAARRKA